MRSLVLAGLVLGACGGGTTVATGQNDAPSTALWTTITTTGLASVPSTTLTSVTTSPTSTPKATTTEKATTGVLAQRDAPSGGAGDQVSFVQGSDPGEPCLGQESSVPAVVPDENQGGRVSMGHHLIMCFPGFTPTVAVEIVLPSGMIRRRSVQTVYQGVVYMAWFPRPGDPLGRHRVTATRGSLRASGEFTVRSSTTPRAIALGRDARTDSPAAENTFVYMPQEPVGATLDIVLAGFRPNQKVKMKFYREKDGSGTDPPVGMYRGTATTSVNGRGEKVYSLDTRGATRGNYMVTTEPAVAGPPNPVFRLT